MMSQLNQSASTFSRFIKSSSLKLLLAPLSAVALLGVGGNFWLSGEANAQTTRTRPTQTNARSNVARLNVTLSIQPNESYDTFMRRADAAASNVAIRSFNQNRSLGTVAVTVSGQNAGNIAPLLSLQVNRQNWANNPDTRRWATYFKNAPILLGINTTNPNVANQPANSNGAAIPGQASGVVNGNNANGVNAAGNEQVPNNITNTNVGADTVNQVNPNGTNLNNVPANNGLVNNGTNLNNVPTTSGQGSNVPTTSGQGSNVPTTSGQGSDVPTTSGQGYDTNLNNRNGNSNGTGFGNTGGTTGNNGNFAPLQ